MDFEVVRDCSSIDWVEVAGILEEVGMGNLGPEIRKIAFEASYAKVFLFSKGRLAGFGRALSDGVHEAAIYDVALRPEYQGSGGGRLIIENLINAIPGVNFILYARPGKEGFYEKMGLSRMRTGMARFLKNDYMRERGFTE
ncbi:MAG: GNAT family N-acetyltransferase [Deltaproteobacteria bacterium]|nr:MAG: GNAT family N-acetyltransferase [Deltaproteobacteria bacterium]